MSENTTDFNKRTCIICGCHTSQTINIYEPRSGPNIVQLIQARFKFQPLNDDKYLCYSCNNWLINWNSLQAVNSNNADNSTINFRSNLNKTKPDMSSALDIKSKMAQCGKKIAIVRPRVREKTNQLPKNESYLIKKTPDKCSSPKLDPCILPRERISQRKTLSSRKALRKSLQASPGLTNKMSSSCVSETNELIRKESYSLILKADKNDNWCSRVQGITSKALPQKEPPVTLPYLPRQNQRTFIDGKIVSMLRRAGTILSTDIRCGSDSCRPAVPIPPSIPQPRKQDVPDDEIVINFNTAISEVIFLPCKLKKDDSDLVAVEGRDELCKKKVSSKINLQQVFSLVPKGLTVSVISNSNKAI